RIARHILACRLLDLTESNGLPVDRLIGLKFPAYLVPHPAKVLWIVHQHRAAYDLWEHPLGDLANAPDGAAVRDLVHDAERRLLPEARALHAISATVAHRLQQHLG